MAIGYVAFQAPAAALKVAKLAAKGAKVLKSPAARKLAKAIGKVRWKAQGKGLIRAKRKFGDVPTKDNVAYSLKEAVEKNLTQYTRKIPGSNRSEQWKVKWKLKDKNKPDGPWEITGKRMKVHRETKGKSQPGRNRKVKEQSTKYLSLIHI